MSPRVSVVTPFYNTAEYLEECIRSVLAQSFADFEYVLLDNCSNDGSRRIAERFATLDRRIRLISNPGHLTQVQNYNAALTAISPHSEYCKMVQADDWLFRRCLEEMVTLADSHPEIGIVSSYRLAGTAVKEVGLPHTSVVTPGREICRKQMLEGLHFFGSPSTILVRSSLIRAREPFYEEGRMHEDTEACYDVLDRHQFGFVHQVLSFTRTDNDSIMSRSRTFGPGLLDKLIIVRRFGPRYLDDAEYRLCRLDHEAAYLRFLGEALLRPQGRDFWDYQRRGWKQIGYRPSRLRLACSAAGALADLVLNPKRTLDRAFRSLRRRLASTARV